MCAAHARSVCDIYVLVINQLSNLCYLTSLKQLGVTHEGDARKLVSAALKAKVKASTFKAKVLGLGLRTRP